MPTNDKPSARKIAEGFFNLVQKSIDSFEQTRDSTRKLFVRLLVKGSLKNNFGFDQHVIRVFLQKDTEVIF